MGISSLDRLSFVSFNLDESFCPLGPHEHPTAAQGFAAPQSQVINQGGRARSAGAGTPSRSRRALAGPARRVCGRTSAGGNRPNPLCEIPYGTTRINFARRRRLQRSLRATRGQGKLSRGRQRLTGLGACGLSLHRLRLTLVRAHATCGRGQPGNATSSCRLRAARSRACRLLSSTMSQGRIADEFHTALG
jgi:hypothetical protein